MNDGTKYRAWAENQQHECRAKPGHLLAPLIALMFAVTTLVWLPLTTAVCSIVVAGLLFGTVLQASSHSTDTTRGVHDDARIID
ncbi:hypothetical protein O4214_12200 [Rhodococcus erythropolis]|uniref:hypothetical protein n=1 Tax=Rhodococcus erythropolis TaxID=1833 RepID=UPI001E380969|nr:MULTISPECIES: hypothetical protein [Rhodococcus erythropolis group]MCD2107806.1 hypothetical protein [Rhodococcus qingshengii]MCZ4524744.1 hypothetical protein [Rhodococcus erythropolis]